MRYENIWVQKAISDARNLFEWGFSEQDVVNRVYSHYTDIYKINDRFTWADLLAVRDALESLFNVRAEV